MTDKSARALYLRITNNYLGKSNWTDESETSQFEGKSELFKGALFDLRGYRTPVSEKKLKESIYWGKGHLGLP